MDAQGTRPIRVLIVEDCRTVRAFLEHLIASDPRLEILASVSSGEEALAIIEQRRPDVISLDICLPGIDGFVVTREVMRRFPTPIVVCSASAKSAELSTAIEALRAGALSVVEKPRGTTHDDYLALAERLCTQLAIMSQVHLVRQRTDARTGPVHRPHATDNGRNPSPVVTSGCDSDKIVGIAASTGGPNALTRLLGALPADFPAPILLVQHITAAFSQGFIRWLDTVTPLQVVEAAAGMRPQAGRVYVAPADRHLEMVGPALRLNTDEPVGGQRPAATVLFDSMALSLGERAIGVILTGMGADGADGLCQLRDAGGFTIAESAQTAVVYGMPAAAVRLGAVCESLALDQIAARLCALVTSPSLAVRM